MTTSNDNEVQRKDPAEVLTDLTLEEQREVLFGDLEVLSGLVQAGKLTKAQLEELVLRYLFAIPKMEQAIGQQKEPLAVTPLNLDKFCSHLSAERRLPVQNGANYGLHLSQLITIKTVHGIVQVTLAQYDASKTAKVAGSAKVTTNKKGNK